MFPQAVTAVWRCVWVPRTLVLVGLLFGVPMALRMPPWVDITLYDNAAHAMLAGEIHYQDVFDTNPPGFVWALTVVRAAFGPSYEALWVVDLAIVLGIVLLIDRLAKWGGASASARWWVFAGVAFFYPFVTEGVHAQRDVWMTLPALAAVTLRVRRSRVPEVVGRSAFGPALAEGLLWGLAVWVKPHVMFMAAGIWLFTALRVASSRRWIGLGLDFLGNFLGGLLVGFVGFFILYASGSLWPYWDVMTIWNTDYVELVRRELELRYDLQLHWFPPWSLFLVPTIPLAILSILDGAVRTRANAGLIGRWLPVCIFDRGDDDYRFARAVLAAAYLLWAFQALYFQRGFQYVHVAETLMMLGLWAAHNWRLPVLVLTWFAITSSLWLVADAHPEFRKELNEWAYCDHERDHYLVRHPLADPQRMATWNECWRTDMTDDDKGRLRDRLKYVRNHEASIGWEELEEVARFFHGLDEPLRDGELICWHDSPHALYLIAGPNRTRIKPGIRFMHVFTVKVMGRDADERMHREVERALPNSRFIVTDLYIATLGQNPESDVWNAIAQPGLEGDLLPPGLDPILRDDFPFNRRAVFRTKNGRGRYVVHDANDWAPSPYNPRVPWPKLGPGIKSVLGFLRDE